MKRLAKLAQAGRAYAVVAEITRDPDPAPGHDYDRDPQSGAGNCRCGAAERHRRHPHTFMGCPRRPSRCVCGLAQGARCHSGPGCPGGDAA